jgi:hypothetical protein
VKVTTDLSPEVEVEFESLDWCGLLWVRLPDLKQLDVRELRRVHLHAMREVFAANGPARMGVGTRVLDPIEAEMRRRGLEACYWSMEQWRRSNQAFRSELN